MTVINVMVGASCTIFLIIGILSFIPNMIMSTHNLAYGLTFILFGSIGLLILLISIIMKKKPQAVPHINQNPLIKDSVRYPIIKKEEPIQKVVRKLEVKKTYANKIIKSNSYQAAMKKVVKRINVNFSYMLINCFTSSRLIFLITALFIEDA
jgi:hypothetical protein